MVRHQLKLERLEDRTAPAFTAFGPFAVGTSPTAMVAADFNNDGNADVAVLNAGDDTVSVLLGNGSASLTPAAGSPLAVPVAVVDLQAADLNGDNNVDLVVSGLGSSSGELHAFLGNGAGQFGPGLPTAISTLADKFTLGLFNADAAPDVAILSTANQTITVLTGAGNGFFNFSDTLFSGSGPDEILNADFDEDGNNDLAVTASSEGNIKVFRGNGNGTFAFTPSTFFADSMPGALAIDDFNNDNHLDFATSSSVANRITILLGDGTGNFNLVPTRPATGANPVDLVSQDFNGDGNRDLAVLNNGDDTVIVLFGDGTGGFTPDPDGPYATGGFPRGLVTADFFRDGRPDLAVSNNSDNNVLILANGSNFDPGPSYATSAGNIGTPRVRAYNRDGSLRFDFLAYDASFKGGSRIALGDIDGDGTVDIVTGAGAGGGPHIKVFNGRDSSVMMSFFAFNSNFNGGVFVATGDVDNDGHKDIVVGAGSTGGPHVRVFSGATGGMIYDFFAYNPSFNGGVRVAVGDVTGDGRADIIVGAGVYGGPHVQVFDGATLHLVRSFFAYDLTFTAGIFVAAGDVNGDGRADIIVGPDVTGGPHVRIFNGATQTLMQEYMAFQDGFNGGIRVAITDIDSDGRADILATEGPLGSGRTRIFRSTTGELLRDFATFGAGFGGSMYVGGDFIVMPA